MTIPNSEGFLSSSCLPCTPEEEKEIVSGLIKHADDNIKEDDLYSLISYTWWMNWKNYVSYDVSDPIITENGHVSNPRPGEIDNSKLVEGTGDEPELKRNLQEGSDYALIPHQVWLKLHEWYKGGPEITRKVICDGFVRIEKIVEVYPLSFTLLDERDKSQNRIIISRKATVRDLYNMVCSLQGIELEKAEIYDYFMETKHKKLDSFDQTLEDAQLQMDQQILLGEKELEWSTWTTPATDSTGNDMALIALQPSTSSVSIAGGPASSNGFGSANGYPQPASFSSPNRDFNNRDLGNRDFEYRFGSSSNGNGGKVEGQGLTGLSNLGNTCFMNSALQCLVHTPQLVEYFLGEYTEEINKDNPLGMQGELAVAFGELLRKVWAAGQMSVAPRAFKAKLARFAPQFSGYNQHDSQELLAFLLDGLHEDLNRVKKKPYIEIEDAEGRPDDVFAQECWRNHKARNDSIIVDICQGQYKSTLVCPVCNKISVTFDPFMYLSLPLPSTLTRSMTVTVFSGNGDSLPMPFTVTVPKTGFVKDLLSALATACCLSPNECLLLAEVYDHKIFRCIENQYEPIVSIKDEELIVAYRLPADREKYLRLDIIHRKSDRLEPEPQYMTRKLIGTPLVTCIPKDCTSLAEINEAISIILTPFIRAKAYPVNNNNTATNGECSKNKSVAKSSSDTSGPTLDSIVLTDNQENQEENDHMQIETQQNNNQENQENNEENQDQIEISIEGDENQAVPPEESSEGDETEATDPQPEHPFVLALTDDKGWDRKPLTENLSGTERTGLRLMMDWRESELARYDAGYMEDLPDVFKAGFMAKKTRQEAVTLFSCLDGFLKEEPLGPDDMWYCPKCKEHRQATKKLDLWKLPEVLVVHLKRFSYSRYFKNKLDTFVNFPIRNLDLSKYIQHAGPASSEKYELYAVINHYGGLGGGHYSAYAKLVEEERWYHFDDSHVSSVMSEEDVRTSAAYVLFYKRVDTTENQEVIMTNNDYDTSSPPSEIPIF
ncbi:hypothetical protein LUZ60_015127 [Juncus effusus]|nr:hypothetical protein LUZ60_015127 [Juncus effusus]